MERVDRSHGFIGETTLEGGGVVVMCLCGWRSKAAFTSHDYDQAHEHTGETDMHDWQMLKEVLAPLAYGGGFAVGIAVAWTLGKGLSDLVDGRRR